MESREDIVVSVDLAGLEEMLDFLLHAVIEMNGTQNAIIKALDRLPEMRPVLNRTPLRQVDLKQLRRVRAKARAR